VTSGAGIQRCLRNGPWIAKTWPGDWTFANRIFLFWENVGQRHRIDQGAGRTSSWALQEVGGSVAGVAFAPEPGEV
jgi:hypothetical protein